jgi:UDP-N-acetylmuramoylalanine--D-glutamate ligase
MKDYRRFFKGKKITQIGLGLLGRGVRDAEFLAENGAVLTVTDLKTEAELAPSLKKLRKYKNISYALGRHHLEDFTGKDFILKAAGVPIDSPFIAEARRSGIPIEMDASLFAALAPAGVKIIGITGTRGKTTTTVLIFEILKRAFGAKKVFLGGNIRDRATLPLLEKVVSGDYVVLELDSWQLQGFGESKISPRIAVFTTFYPDHLNYYKGDIGRYFEDKANIFRFQKKGDALVVGEQAAARLLAAPPPIAPTLAKTADIPPDWKLKIPGEHNRANAACTLAVARALSVPDSLSREVMENFKGVPGRLEYLRTVRGVKVYNDNSSTTPDATVAALRALGSKTERVVVLIVGGDDKGLDMSGLITEIPQYCSRVVLFKERGTERIKKEIFKLEERGIRVFEEEGLPATLSRAFSVVRPGEIILYSPAFSSFGKYFKNEYDRGGRFVELVKKLK